MTLSKSCIVELVADQNGYSKKQAFEVVESLIRIIKEALVSGDDVLVTGFGKFCVKAKQERVGRNPATGEPMRLWPRRVVTFKCSGKLRDRINDE